MAQRKTNHIIAAVIIFITVAATIIITFATLNTRSLTYGDYTATRCIYVWLASDSPDSARCKEEGSTLRLTKDSITITYSPSEETSCDGIVYRKNNNVDQLLKELTDWKYEVPECNAPILYDVCEKDTIRYKLLTFDNTIWVFTPGTHAFFSEDDDIVLNSYTITEYVQE